MLHIIHFNMSQRFVRKQGSISLEHIKVRNFKSFKNLDISLNKFNIVIGANASGKSNFAQLFKFFSDIALYGLEDAISRQGGMEYLLNFTSPDANLSYEITFNTRTTSPRFFIERVLRRMLKRKLVREYNLTKVVYRFEIKAKSNSKIKIIDDEWQLIVDVAVEKKTIPLIIKIKNENDELKIYINSQSGKLKNEIVHIKKTTEEFLAGVLEKPQLSLEHPVITRYMLSGVGDFCSDIKVYDFDPKLAKLAVQIKGASELEPDGANLAIAMKNVMDDLDNQNMFSNLITDVLPFVHSVDTTKLLDRSVILTQTENYFKDKSIPATLISDGTINVTALLCALYFQSNSLIIIEEPERNIHPSLIAKIANMLKDASNKKQIIATTHSTEIIKHIDVENLLLIRRDKSGNSKIIKPGDQAVVQKFLENNIDIRELYVQNMLDD